MFKTTHKEFAIEYNEQASVWTCAELNLSAGQLGRLRSDIDKFGANLRSASVPAVRLAGIWSMARMDDDPSGLAACTITTIIDTQQCWINNERGERETELISNLFPVNEATQIAHAALIAAYKVAGDARDAANKCWKDMPRFTAEQLIEKFDVPQLPAAALSAMRDNQLLHRLGEASGA